MGLAVRLPCNVGKNKEEENISVRNMPVLCPENDHRRVQRIVKVKKIQDMPLMKSGMCHVVWALDRCLYRIC